MPAIGCSLLTWSMISALLYWYLPLYSSIALGVTAAIAASKFGPFHVKLLPRLVLSSVAIGAVIALASAYSVQLLAAPFSIAVVLLLARVGTPTWLGAVVGGVSYPLYLNHWTGEFVAHAALKPFGLRDSAAAHVISVTFAIGFSYVMYRLVDRPLLRHRSRYFTPARGYVAMVVAYGLVIVGLTVGVLLRWQ
jgi:peptidoglycan/LPS O-acetylase OafA/YrhL